MPDSQPKHYVPLTGIGGIWGDPNDPANPPDWNWTVEKWENASGHFKDPDAVDVGFRYEMTADTLDVTIVWAEPWLKPLNVTVYDLDETQDLSKDGLDRLGDAAMKEKPSTKAYGEQTTATKKINDRQYLYRFTISQDFKRSGLLISVKFQRDDTAPGLTHYYTGVFAISVTALPAVHFYLGDAYWFSLMQDDDATQPPGKKYLLYYEDGVAAHSTLVANQDGSQASLMSAESASPLGEEDIAFFGMLAPFSIFRQMWNTKGILGKQFLANLFTDLANAGSLSSMVSFHGSTLALFSTAWQRVQGMMPLPDDGFSRVKNGITTFLDSKQPPLTRLYALGTVVYEAGDTLLALFPEAVGEVAGKLVYKVVAVTGAELKAALKVTVEVVSEQCKALIEGLEELKASLPRLAAQIDQNISDLRAMLGQLELQPAILGPEIDAIPQAQLNAKWSDLGQKGTELWGTKVKESVGYLEKEVSAGRMEKLAKRHFRTKGAVISDGVKPGIGCEEAFEQTIWFKDVDQAAVLDAINNSALSAGDKQTLLDFAKARFKEGKCCRIDHIRIEHGSRIVQIVDKTGSWNCDHRLKTDFYKYVFENCLKNSSNSFGGVAYSKLGYVVRAIEYFWRE